MIEKLIADQRENIDELIEAVEGLTTIVVTVEELLQLQAKKIASMELEVQAIKFSKSLDDADKIGG